MQLNIIHIYKLSNIKLQMVNRRNRRRNNRPRKQNNMIRGSTRCMPYQQFATGTASLSAGNNLVTYTIANLFSDLNNRVGFPTNFTVKFEPIFPTGSTPGTNIVFAQLVFRDPATLTDVPASTIKLLSQTNSTRLTARLPKQASGWFASSNTTIILSVNIRVSIACNLNYEIDSRALLCIDLLT